MSTEKRFSLRSIALIGFILMIAGYATAITETIYFGSNWLPESREEMTWDLISVSISTAGTVLFMYALMERLFNTIRELNK